MPDCNKCIWSTRDGRCVSWECDFISHEDARRIDWLSELAERRKAPEIITCGECKHRDPEDKKCDCGHDIIWQLPRGDNWYCADAEKKHVENG